MKFIIQAASWLLWLLLSALIQIYCEKKVEQKGKKMFGEGRKFEV